MTPIVKWMTDEKRFNRGMLALYILMLVVILTACGQARAAQDSPHARTRIPRDTMTTVYKRTE